MQITIIDEDRVIYLRSIAQTPSKLIAEAGISLANADIIQFHGTTLPLEFPLPTSDHYVLQVKRANQVTLITPDTHLIFQSSARNVGEALSQTGLVIFSSDYITPPLDTPLTANTVIQYRPAKDLTISTGQQTFAIKTSQNTVGRALTAAGIPLLGLDKTEPNETAPLPVDGQIRINRVHEVVILEETPIPFAKKYEYSETLTPGEQKIIQIGIPGLSQSRTRVNYVDGLEKFRTTEPQIDVRMPQDSIISLSTNAKILTLDTPEGQIQYWRAISMYTTSYSPCRSGTSQCLYGTASGIPVRHGVVAVTPYYYNLLAGTRVYVPGYGIGVIGDVGGGFPDGRLWIDLGYSDDDYQSWSGYQVVYFLAPAPPTIPAGLN